MTSVGTTLCSSFTTSKARAARRRNITPTSRAYAIDSEFSRSKLSTDSKMKNRSPVGPTADQSLSEVEDSSSDKCGRRDLNPGVCSDCSNYQRGRPAYPRGLMSWTRLSSL